MTRVFALFALACSTCTTVPNPAPGHTAALGQTAYVDGLRVKPLAIVEDSRCPANVTCVWAGRLVIRAEVSGGHWRQTRDFELRKPQPIGDGQLTLVEAAPGKMAGQPTAPGDYRFTFAFEGGL
jgi:hypothetical protein